MRKGEQEPMKKWILEWKTVSGKPYQIGDVTLTPQSQALLLKTPIGGVVWNRPVAVVAERAGESQRHAVDDVTRRAIVAMVGITVGIAVIGRVVANVLASKSGKKNGR